MALCHTVVIRYSASVTYKTQCHANGQLVIYRECYGFERVLFTLWRFLIPSCFFKSSLGGAGSSTSKLAGSRDMTRARPDYLFESHQSKRFLWGRFFIRARAGQSQSVNLRRELVLQNIIFEMFASYKIWKLFTKGEHVTSHNR